MWSKYSRLRFRRKLRARTKILSQTKESANREIERHIFRRLHNWRFARRFFISWLSLALLMGFVLTLQLRFLGSTYLVNAPIAGGIYSEGIVGNIKNINPLFATTSADNAVSALMFSSLLAYDDKNTLKGDLALSWQNNALGNVYTVKLRDNIFWHDGEKFTADDVVYTYKTIQDPDANATLYNSWRGIKVQKKDDFTVTFTLPNAYSPFLHLLTNGIVPEHKLASIESKQLRSARFNASDPIGTGPFKWRSISVKKQGTLQTETVQLVRNEQYHKGVVQLDGFTVKTFDQKTDLIEALRKKEVIGAAGVDVADASNYETLRFTQTSALMIFLNTAVGDTKNIAFRRALISATDVVTLSQKLGYPTRTVREPILKGQIGYNGTLQQLPYNKDSVNEALDNLGWKWNNGEPYRKKGNQELNVRLSSENSAEYAMLAEEIQKQWAEFGIKTTVVLEDPDEISSTALDTKDYDALLYAINIGADPDVFVYWHSSQAKADARPGFNLSLYSSKKADTALEAGRSRLDPKLRAVKYKGFLEAWRADIPAIAIHQPRYPYTTSIPVYGFKETTINTLSDRYQNVMNWQINTAKASNSKNSI